LKNDSQYGADKVLDGSKKTAWVEGANGLGINEWIRLDTDDGSSMTVRTIELQLGYQKSESTLSKNGWPTKLRIQAADGWEKTVEFQDYNDVILLDQPLTTPWVRFTVEAAELDMELEKNEEVEYSGKPVPAIEKPELPEGVHFMFALFDSKAAAEEGEEPTKVFDEDEIPAFDKPGTYYLGVVIYDEDGNYEFIYDTVTMKITEPAPETGDTFNAGLWVGLLAASAVLAIALFVVLRRRKEQE
jgi:LPXTG-motif cell wall-anchored protein